MQMFRPNIGTNLTVQTLTGATTIPTTAQVLLLSGTTFAVTLPAAASTTGQTFQFLKTDSISTAMSIVGTGLAAVTLSTALEQYSIVSDGTTYWPMSHTWDTSGISFTPTTFGIGTLGNSGFCSWSRDGNSLKMVGRIMAGTVSGTTVGQVCLPSPLVMRGGSFGLQLVGAATSSVAATASFYGLGAEGATNISFSPTTTGNPIGGNIVGASLATTNGPLSIQLDIPIKGWGA